MNNIRSIEDWVDNIRPVPKRQVRNPKRIGKRSKYSALLVVFLLVGAVGGFATIYTYFTQINSDATVTEYLFTFDDEGAEDYTIDEDFNIMGSGYISFTHWMNLSASSPDDVVVDFVWSGNLSSDGILAALYWNDSGTWTLISDNDATTGDHTFSAGDNIELETRYAADEKISYDTYTHILTID